MSPTGFSGSSHRNMGGCRQPLGRECGQLSVRGSSWRRSLAIKGEAAAFEAVAEGASADAEQARGLGDIPGRMVHCGLKQALLDGRQRA